MRVAMMTREYPPEVYGGAGVHVTELVAQLRRLCAVDVHCMGAPRPGAFAYQPDPRFHGANAALSTLSSDLAMANAASAATVVHSHTWYTGLAGHLAALLYDVPHVLTAHSLEPLRPWKAEQLGGGYRVSTWVEHTAVLAADAIIAVSAGMREDVLRVYPSLDPSLVHVIRNGIDTDVWYPAGPVRTGSVLTELGVDPSRPTAVFVGRITRQKGVAHLVAAAHQFSPDVQLVLPEVVADGITGSLVHYDPDDPTGYQARLADAVNKLIADPEKAKRYGEAGRRRCIEEFSWAHVAEQTLDIYRKVCA
ncbi:MAG: glycogen synthase [Mycobacterium sp.]